MKNIIIILFIVLFGMHANSTYAQSDELVNVCALGIGNATYLKDYKVKMSGSSVSPPTTRFNIIMNKGTMYKFTVCNAEDSPGRAVVKLMENNTLLGTNQKSDGTLMKSIGFQCQKTGVYSIVVSFKDGKEGAAVVIHSYINM